MEFSDDVQLKIDLINQALSELGASNVFTNSDFTPSEFIDKYYVSLQLNSDDRNVIPITIRLTDDVIEIDLDLTAEIYTWSKDVIERSPGDFVKFIKQLFSGHILVEYCGSNYTAFSVFDQEAKALFRTPVITGLFWKRNCRKRLFFPIYPQC